MLVIYTAAELYEFCANQHYNNILCMLIKGDAGVLPIWLLAVARV